MQSPIRERVHGALTATAGLLLFVGGLALIDGRVRRQLTAMFAGPGPTEELVAFHERLGELLFIALQAIRDQTIEHAPLVIFSLAAAVLMLFMMRTT
jgi:hypothetical protein